jgi:hypothetical protein
MKPSNLFKKSNASVKVSRIESLSKEKLGKVSGGDGGVTPVPVPQEANKVKSHSNQSNN